ncbi:hypothetical protein [uncultured Cohaesibacter sp.]|uniref:hypothetical protein n=1 Tax=uncultured Cohaesibacter sp. TaxID=1002546 RepID=UPI0029C8A342|nr:hypothetical protein [uncultured Cohaesibacter sp.]
MRQLHFGHFNTEIGDQDRIRRHFVKLGELLALIPESEQARRSDEQHQGNLNQKTRIDAMPNFKLGQEVAFAYRLGRVNDSLCRFHWWNLRAKPRLGKGNFEVV